MSQRALHAGDSHQLLRDRTIGDGGHPQLATKKELASAVALAGTFIPIAALDPGAVPDTGSLVTGQLQNALDSATPGDTIAFANGLYLIDGPGLTSQSGISYFLSPGTIIKQTNGLAVFDFKGTLSATTTLLGANAAAGDYQLQVVSTAGFPDGCWVKVSDTLVALRDHMELVQVRTASSGTTLELFHPLIDDYTLARTGRVTLVTPAENIHLWGQGVLTNPSFDANEGKCLRYEYAIKCTVEGIEIRDFGLEAVGYLNSAHCRATGLRIHDGTRFNAASPSLVGFGYGITSAESHNLLWDHNRIWRTRHALDVSFLSRHVTVDHNEVKAQASTAIQTHPYTKHTLILGNEIDGVVGYDATGFLFGGEEGSGIGIRDNCEGAIIANNTLRNIYGSGIIVNGDFNSDIHIINNTLNGVNLDVGVTHAGIRAQGTQTTNTCPGLVIAHNTITNYRVHAILCGYDDVDIRHNTIRNTTAEVYGIYCYSRISGVPVNRPHFLKNRIFGGTYGIYLGGSRNGEVSAGRLINEAWVEGNLIVGTLNEGIAHDNDRAGASTNDYCTGGTIKGNRVIGCNSDASTGEAGILLADSTTITSNLFRYNIIGNFVSGSSHTGIRAVGNGTVIHDNECSITSGTGFGIRVAPLASGATVQVVTVTNNRCRGCSTDGIRVEATSGGGATVNDVVIEGNHCNNNNAWGIRVGTGAVNTVLLPNWGEGNASGFFTDAGTTTQIVLFTDPVNNRVGLGTGAPAETLDVRGTVQIQVDDTEALSVEDAGANSIVTVDTTTPITTALCDVLIKKTSSFALDVQDDSAATAFLVDTDAHKTTVTGPGPSDVAFEVTNGETTLGALTLFGSLKNNRTAVASSPYNVVAADMHLSVSTAAARTINLPAASDAAGRTLIINDSVGAGANTNNITIARAGGDTINQVAGNLVIATLRASVTLESDGTSNWEIVASHLL